LNAKIGGLDFLEISGCDTICHSQGAPRYYRYAIQIENLVFVYELSMNIPIFS